MKRFLSILTALVLCVCMFTTTLSATEPIDSTGLSASFTMGSADSKITISNMGYQKIGMLANNSRKYTLRAGSAISTCVYGIYATDTSTVTIKGGNFTNNYVGVYVYGTGVTFTLQGEVVISGNSYINNNETVDCNVYLDSGALITLGELSTGSSIGITTDTKPTVGNPVQITTAEAGGNTEYYKTAAEYFFSDDPRYTVTVNETGGYLELSVAYFDVDVDSSIENGTLTVSTTSAIAGETVSFTIEPNAGYAVGEVTVTSASGAVSVTESNGVYSFVMPAEAVTISAVLNKSSSGVSGTIYVNEQYHGIFINGHLACIPHTVDENGYCTVCKEYIGIEAEETEEETEIVEETVVEVDEPVEGTDIDTELDG
ncbi:MAG: hypothetical protein LUE20_04225 [Oscillospiraceae bacterium]|nr:hypothetical protein [Oscillospiraceae bacterium]